MLRFILWFYIILLYFLPVHAQSDKSTVKPVGLYFGGESYGESMNGIGYYYFKPDSSFIFLRPGFKTYTKTKEFKDQFNDTLIGYGKGHWFLKDGFFVVKFETVLDENILNGDMKYHTYSKPPYDSLFLQVQVSNYDEKTLRLARITFLDKGTGAVTDTAGYFKITVPIKYKNYQLAIYKEGYSDQKIKLKQDYNVHEIAVTLAVKDNSTIELVSEVKFPFKFHYKNGRLIIDGKLRKQNEGKEKLISFIKNSYQKFPRQTTFLSMILEELK